MPEIPIKVIKDKEGNPYFPYTHLKAVRDDEGATLETMLQAKAFGRATCTTAASETAKAVTVNEYNLMVGGIVTVTFENAVPAASTLNVSGKGAKPITYDGAAVTAGIIGAGDTVLLQYTGTAYDVIAFSKESYSKDEIDAMRAPTYNASTKGIAFAANSDATYNPATKGISLSH